MYKANRPINRQEVVGIPIAKPSHLSWYREPRYHLVYLGRHHVHHLRRLNFTTSRHHSLCLAITISLSSIVDLIMVWDTHIVEGPGCFESVVR